MTKPAKITLTPRDRIAKEVRAGYDEGVTEAKRQRLVQLANTDKVGIVHIFDRNDPKGGLTVAFRKTSPHANGNMVEVAVATCSYADTFSKKIGTYHALTAFFKGDTIQLPLSRGYAEEDLNGRVKDAFTNMYESLKYAI